MAAAKDLPVGIRQGESRCYNTVRGISNGEKAGDGSRVGEDAKQRCLMGHMKAAEEFTVSDKEVPTLAYKGRAEEACRM